MEIVSIQHKILIVLGVWLGFLDECSVLDAVVVAMDVLVRAVASAKRVGEKKIYLITDVGSEYTDDGLAQIAAGLKEKNVQLIVV